MGGWVSGGMGGCPHMHTHTCIEFQMAASMEASMFSMFNMNVCACVHVCVHAYVHGTPLHTPIPTPPPSTNLPPPQGVDPQNNLKFNNTST